MNKTGKSEIKIPFDHEYLGELLAQAAAQDGASHWAEWNFDADTVRRILALEKNTFIPIKDKHTGQVHRLFYSNMMGGLHLMAEHHFPWFAEAVEENDGPETGDVYLQCCIFGTYTYTNPVAEKAREEGRAEPKKVKYNKLRALTMVRDERDTYHVTAHADSGASVTPNPAQGFKDPMEALKVVMQNFTRDGKMK